MLTNTTKGVKSDPLLGSEAVLGLLKASSATGILGRVETPEDYDKLDDHDKSVFLLLLFNLIWRANSCKAIHIYSVIESFLGAARMPQNCIGVNSLESLPGIVCALKEQLRLLGLHCHATKSISYLLDADKAPFAVSVVLNGGYDEYCDFGSKFIYLGQSGTKSTLDCDQSMASWDNLSLLNSSKMEYPVRVIRGTGGRSGYSPRSGYRYDGLYRIIDFFGDTSHSDRQVYKYVFALIEAKRYKVPHLMGMHQSIVPPLLRVNHPQLANCLIRHGKLRRRRQREIKRAAPISRVADVLVDGKIAFRIAIPEIVESEYGGDACVLVNFYILLESLKQGCNKYLKGASNGWLKVLGEYEMSDSHLAKPQWAKGGFLPLLLRVSYQRMKGAITSKSDGGKANGIYEHNCHVDIHQEGCRYSLLPVNRLMAKRLARPFFPQCKSQGIFTQIMLCAPMRNDWSPWEDLSHGEEKYALKVVNNVDKAEPPLDFSYCKSSIFFCRLLHSSLFKGCPGCLPPGVDTSNWETKSSANYCVGKIHPITGEVLCAGRDRDKLCFHSCEFTCGDFCPCNPSTCKNRFPCGLQFQCKITKTVMKNWELQTEEFIPKGSFILQYAGEFISRVIMEGRELSLEKLGLANYFMEAVENEDREDDWLMPCVDSTVIGNAARFLNHSCEPNVEIRTIWCCSDFPELCAFALRDIYPNESLTYYYGSSYRQMKCYCGSSNCEGFIGKKYLSSRIA